MSEKQQKFDKIYQDHFAMVRQLCLGFVKGDQDAADDLTQESFINSWNALEKFKGTSSYKTWLYRITVNTCLKYVRDRRNQTTTLETHHTFRLRTEQNHGDENSQELYQAIGQLKEMDRLIIMMILDELEYPEIAEIVGISEGNLRVKIHRIKKQLKDILSHG